MVFLSAILTMALRVAFYEGFPFRDGTIVSKKSIFSINFLGGTLANEMKNYSQNIIMRDKVDDCADGIFVNAYPLFCCEESFLRSTALTYMCFSKLSILIVTMSNFPICNKYE